MLSLFILFIIIIFKAEARGPDNDPVKITFKIHAEVSNEGAVNLFCDHYEYKKLGNTYTVLEGEEFRIYTKYDSYINHVICYNYSNSAYNPYMEKSGSKNITIFKADKTMGGLWNCTVLFHRDHPSPTFPKVQYKNATYSAAYCNVAIHVRLRDSPQTILVNNMKLATVRTDLSEEDVDFTAVYHYADGDIANVTCIDFLNPNDATLTMIYAMADSGTISDKIPIHGMDYKVVGFIANLHSRHNNSYMLCNTKQIGRDNTMVMVRFVKRTEFNIISVRMNGMTVRPRKFVDNDYYIFYIYESLHPINVVCDVQHTDVTLAVNDDDFIDVNNYSKTELLPTKKAEMSFYLDGKFNSLVCEVSNSTGAIAEKITFFFNAAYFYTENIGVVLHIKSNGTAMDSYITDREFKIIYYEYNDGEILQLECGPLLLSPNATPYYNLSLHFGDSDACSTQGCILSKTFKVSRRDHNTKVVCYLKDDYSSLGLNWFTNELVVSEIRVILRARVLTTTSTTTTTSPVTALTTTTTTNNTASDPASSGTSTSNTLLYCGSAAGVAVIAILVVGGYWTVKKRWCCVRSTSQELPSIPTPRPDPASVYYQNLLSVFQPINEREAAELEHHYEGAADMEMENIYEEVE